MAPAVGAVIATPERRDPTASAGTRATGSDNDAAKRRALRASASGEQHRMSARIEAGRPRPPWGSVHESRSGLPDAPLNIVHFFRD
jgi:hypothetical protein